MLAWGYVEATAVILASAASRTSAEEPSTASVLSCDHMCAEFLHCTAAAAGSCALLLHICMLQGGLWGPPGAPPPPAPAPQQQPPPGQYQQYGGAHTLRLLNTSSTCSSTSSCSSASACSSTSACRRVAPNVRLLLGGHCVGTIMHVDIVRYGSTQVALCLASCGNGNHSRILSSLKCTEGQHMLMVVLTHRRAVPLVCMYCLLCCAVLQGPQVAPWLLVWPPQ